MATFTATHGVEFGEPDANGTYTTWARFEPDRSGRHAYLFTTDDEAVAERLRAVNDYGITEIDAPPAS